MTSTQGNANWHGEDINLPAFLRRIRSEEREDTGHVQSALAERARSSGCDELPRDVIPVEIVQEAPPPAFEALQAVGSPHPVTGHGLTPVVLVVPVTVNVAAPAVAAPQCQCHNEPTDNNAEVVKAALRLAGPIAAAVLGLPYL